MKLSITYAELQDYVASHFHKTVNLGYVDGATVSVSIPIKVLGFTKSVSINITVKKIEGTDLFLSYGGKMGIDLLVSPAISYAKKLVPEKVGWVEQMPGNIVKLRLGDIDKLQKVFEKLKLDNEEIWVQALGQEDPLEKGMATTLEEPGGLQSTGWQRVGHN